MHAAAQRFDSWVNTATGIGSTALDKAVNALFYRTQRRSDEYYENLYDDDPFARRICEKLPEEMLRAGVELSMGGADGAIELATEVQDELTRLEAFGRIKDGLVWERVFGGGAVLIGADDGMLDPAMPLQEGNLRRITHLTTLDKPRIYASRWYPPTHDKAGQVELWSLQPFDPAGGAGTVEVHESRLLIFPGGRVTQNRRLELQGWGHSVLAAVHDILREYNMSWGGISNMLQSAQQDVWYLKDYRSAMAEGTSEMQEYFAARFRLAQMKMGPNRGAVLDSDGEKFERFGATLTGIPDTLQQMNLRLCAATDMPATVLFGMAPAGMNATGESDMQQWDAIASSKREAKARGPLERVIELLLLSKEGPTRGQTVDGWKLSFKPLRELTPTQQAELRNKQADTDSKMIEAQVLLPEEVAQARFRPEGYSIETTIDWAAREQMLKEQREIEAQAEAEAKAQMEQQLKGGGDDDDPDLDDPDDDPDE